MAMRIGAYILSLIVAIGNMPCLAQGQKEYSLDAVLKQLDDVADRLRPMYIGVQVSNAQWASEAASLAVAMTADAAPHLASIARLQVSKELHGSSRRAQQLAHFALAALVANGKLSLDDYEALLPDRKKALFALAFTATPDVIRRYLAEHEMPAGSLASPMVMGLLVATGDEATAARIRELADAPELPVVLRATGQNAVDARNRLLLAAQLLERRLGTPPDQSERQSHFLLEFWRILNQDLASAQPRRPFEEGTIIGVAVWLFHQQQGRIDGESLIHLAANSQETQTIWGESAPLAARVLLRSYFTELGKDMQDSVSASPDPELRAIAAHALRAPGPVEVLPRYPMGPPSAEAEPTNTLDK